MGETHPYDVAVGEDPQRELAELSQSYLVDGNV
jgi:hypothetical protein